MTGTATAGGINAALAKLQTELPRITKDLTARVKSERAQYTYHYADLAQISQAVLPLLGKLGLAFISCPTLAGGKFVLAYELVHESGESKQGVYPLPERGSPQEIGGAITYARRYCLCAVTGVAPEDGDDDAQAAERAAQRRERKESHSPRTAPGTNEPAITADDQRAMQKLFRDVGLVDRDDKVKRVNEIIKRPRPVNSATELTHAEAQKVISDLLREARERASKAQPTTTDVEALWGQIENAAPWKGDELERRFCDVAGRSSDEATAEDMRRFLASIEQAGVGQQ